MPTILLEQIIALLTGWKDSFFIWANAIGDKIASIKTNTDSLPDIKDNTDDIKDNTAAVITPISNINTNVSSISGDTASIRTDAGIIKNNTQAIATSSGQAAAFAQDVANNTLEVKNKVVTIASDTTQMRADSGSIRADVSEIKNTLGLYLYNTIVTEDAEGAIALCDTDLQEYLQKAAVTIPADAGGISECKIGYVDFNQIINPIRYANSQTFGGSITYTKNNDGSITFNGTNTSGSTANFVILPDSNTSFISGHVYFVGGVLSGSLNTYYLMDSDNIKYLTEPMVYKSNVTKTFNSAFRFRAANGCEFNNVTLKPFVIDLTQAFGDAAANELLNNPEYAIAIFNKNYYSYDVGGSLVSVESVNGSYYPNASVSFGSSITDGGTLDLTTGLLTVNTTPPTLIQLAPAPIKTLNGLNGIWADIGDIDVTYRETLKHYLEKQQ